MTRTAPVKFTAKPEGVVPTRRSDIGARAAASAAPGRLWRIFRRPKPSLFQRCLAIHVHNAAPPSAFG